ncbi:MAG: GNAT family N-acetyltransferase [Chloroflexota bacterium]|nr:GNAT family N-acetyltransferase [Chloroflexota bacterium]
MTVPSRTGTPLSAEVLARRAALPVKFAPITLTGAFVRLEPLDLDRDVDALYAVSNGQPARLGDRAIPAYDAEAIIWRYMSAGPFADAGALRDSLRAQVDAPNGLCLCVFDQATGQQVGAVNFMANMPEHLKVELGSIWYSPLVQRTKASLESTSLMLAHAFAIGYRRVEWKCDAFNERSRRSALRMGFQFEGIQEAHYIVKGRNRDTAWFRMLDHEWPSVKTRLEAMLEA